MSISYVMKIPEEWSFEKEGIKGKLFSTENLTRQAEFFVIETEVGHETEIIEHGCDKMFYVLSGIASFIINGVEERAEVGDLVVVPSGTRFTYKGRLKMLAVTVPPWWESQEETVG